VLSGGGVVSEAEDSSEPTVGGCVGSDNVVIALDSDEAERPDGNASSIFFLACATYNTMNSPKRATMAKIRRSIFLTCRFPLRRLADET
jgi:hypothetical protein